MVRGYRDSNDVNFKEFGMHVVSRDPERQELAQPFQFGPRNGLNGRDTAMIAARLYFAREYRTAGGIVTDEINLPAPAAPVPL